MSRRANEEAIADVLESLVRLGPLLPRELVEDTGRTPDSVTRALVHLARRGLARLEQRHRGHPRRGDRWVATRLTDVE